MAFKVGAQTAAPVGKKGRHGIDIMAQSIQIQEQGGGVNCGKGFAHDHCFGAVE
jgi:hypothetical protein